jgi:hypothetical protein
VHQDENTEAGAVSSVNHHNNIGFLGAGNFSIVLLMTHLSREAIRIQ